jgi:hypothetical protein
MIYNDHKIKDNLKYLDQILKVSLEKANNYKIDAQTLASNINPFDFETLFSETWADKVKSWFVKPISLADIDFEIPEEFNSEESKFVSALWYLHSQGLIYFEPYPANTVLLTFSGIIKISNGGYLKEFKRQRRRDLYQKYFWIVAILTFIAGWILKPSIEILIEYFNSK